MWHLERAATGTRLSRYHLEAGIAAEHAVAPSWAETNWTRILTYYDQLSVLAPSPVAALNRAVALAMLEGPEAGLAALSSLEQDLPDYYLLPAVQAELLVRAGQIGRAASAYDRALELAVDRPERPWLEERRARASAR